MKQKLFIFISILMIIPCFAFAQRTVGQTQTNLYNLTVTCNVSNAEVMITGDGITGVLEGQTPFSTKLKKQVYSVTVKAPGYVSETKSFGLSGHKTINFDLESTNFTLSVSSNVSGASVLIKGGGQMRVGTTDMAMQLPADDYKVTVEAVGHETRSQWVNLSSNRSLYFSLQPLTAEVRIIIDNSILNTDLENSESRIRIFDNGQRLIGNVFNLNSGQHTIRVESGGISFETTIQIEAGKTYRIEPYGGFIINNRRM